jgi:hypothetical protein
MRKVKFPLPDACRELASALADGRHATPVWMEPGEFDPFINQLYRSADILERSLVSLGLQWPADRERIERLAICRTCKRLWERGNDGKPYQG